MKTMLISEFKTHCVGVLNEVSTTGRHVLVTKRGKPVAQIIPVPLRPQTQSVSGDCEGLVSFSEEIVATDDSEAWETLTP